MLKQLYLPMAFVAFTHSFAQTLHDGLSVSTTQFNYPKTENWISHIDSVEIRNVSSKKIVLLKQRPPREFQVRIPAAALEAGESVMMEIVYKPSGTGKFNSSFDLYHSASSSPITITYKGEVKGFDPYNEVACPSFSKPNLKPIDFAMEIFVIDSLTKKPLGNSFLEISMGEFYTQHKTDNGGRFVQKARIYYYTVLAEKEGYKSKAISTHLNPRNYRMTIALPPTKEKTSTSEILAPVVIAKKETIEAKPITPATAPPSSHSEFPTSSYKKNNIIFLIDKSSSMNKPDCLPLLQTTMKQLAAMTRSEDRITIITYSNDAKVVLPGTNGNEYEKISAAINALQCGGRTEGGKAITMAYNNAEDYFIKGGVNQIILATDGGFNGIAEDEGELMNLVQEKTNQGILLSVLAFGQNRYGKAHINRLANQGKGFYLYIQTEEDARQKLTDKIKIQSKIE
jgi:Mg-chelatase subunit ChlD